MESPSSPRNDSAEDLVPFIPLPRDGEDPPGADQADQLDAVESLPSAGDVAIAVGRLLEPKHVGVTYDVVLNGVVELLGAGSLHAEVLLERLAGMWPGAGLTALGLDSVLGAGRSSGLLIEGADREGRTVWGLTEVGQQELKSTRSWRDGVYQRVAAEIQDLAQEALGYRPTDAQALLWAKHLATGITVGIEAAGSAFEGDVHHLDELCLMPHSVDKAALHRALASGVERADVREMLIACAVAALDPTDVFGSELVTLVVTGFVLHAVVARRDRARDHTVVGSLRGQRVALDTPILIALLGGSKARPIERILRAGHEAGISVEVPEHYLDELVLSVEACGESYPGVRASGDVTRELMYLGRLAEGDILSTYMQAKVEDLYASWPDFERAARQLRQKLRELGVVVRPHGNLDADTVEQCRDALAAALAARGKHRSAEGIVRDANTMAMVWRWRRRRDRAAAWPGGWVITPDRQMAPIMESLDRTSDWPFCLTLPQFAALLTRCTDVPDSCDLTRSTAAVMLHEAAEAVATRFPPSIAAALALGISDGVRELTCGWSRECQRS